MHDDLLARAQRLERLAQMDPGNHALRLDLARAYHLAGRHEAALGVLDAAGDKLKQGLPLRGELLLALGRWEEAIAFYRDAAAADQRSAPIAFNLAYATWASGAPPEASIPLFRMAVRLDPSSQRAWRLLATVLSDADEPASAVETIEQALPLAPEDAETLALAAQLHMEAGRLDTAAVYADRSVAAAPGAAAGWAIKGTIALFALDAAGAWKSLRQAVDLAPHDINTQVSLAQAALMQGRARHARNTLEGVLAAEPGNTSALCMLGWACLAEDDSEVAAAAFARATVEEPDNADAWAGTALVALGAGQNERATAAAERALALEPQQPVARLVRARLTEAADDPAQAKAIAESVLAQSPGSPLGTDLRGVLGSARGQKLVARQQRRLTRLAQSKARQH